METIAKVKKATRLLYLTLACLAIATFTQTLYLVVELTNSNESQLLPIIVEIVLISIAVLTIKAYLDFKNTLPDLEEMQQKSALAALMQMVAHDVRKPFSLCKIVIQTVFELNIESKHRKYLEHAKSELDKSISDTESLLEDLLEINKNQTVDRTPLSIEKILYECLIKTGQHLDPTYPLQIEYDFRHKNKVLGSKKKLARVINNLIQNAFQAMPTGGKIWFQCIRIADDNMLEIAIGNSNSYIPPEKREVIFNSFFSEGKEHGTGLGLAIVQKIVRELGGEIWIVSSKETGTEFRFTLPSDPAKKTEPIDHLPRSREDLPRFESNRLQIKPTKQRIGKRIEASILHIDREPFYLTSVKEMIDNKFRESDSVHYHTLSSLPNTPGEGWPKTLEQELIIVDSDYYDLQVILKILKLAPNCKNLILHGYQKPSYLSQIAFNHEFLSKPLTTKRILTFLRQLEKGSTNEKLETKQVKQETKKNIIVVDDSPFILERWKNLNKSQYDVHLFLGPEEFRQSWNSGKIDKSSLACIILDYYFGDGQDTTGLHLAREIRKEESMQDLQILLCSDRDIDDPEKLFNKKIEKEPVAIEALELKQKE